MQEKLAVLFWTLAVVMLSHAALAEPKRVPVVIDTDIGGDIDDAYALALALTSPELQIRGITTVGRGGPPDPYVQHISRERDEDRAWLICRFLTQVGVQGIPVSAGADPQPHLPVDWEIQYRRHPAAIYNRTLKPVAESAAELMARLANEADGELTILAIGPLTNVARLLQDHPAAARKVKRVVLMGGSIAIGFGGKPQPEPEWNIKSDIAAARTVFAGSIPLMVIPLDITGTLRLEQPQREAIFAARTPLTWQVQNLYELWNRETPVLFDPVAVMAAYDESPLTFKEMRLQVSDNGMTVAVEGSPNARVGVGLTVDTFLQSFAQRLRSHGQESLPQPPGNPSKLIEPGLFPARVHTFEDYDTDIEQRWWMCGKLEVKDVPAAGGRAQRAVLTQDFDDLQGAVRTMYRAVIFNPVPGPPMGANTRLRFKYKLAGTDTIRVQLYSLSNGYHRYFSVAGLEQGKWLEGCVDMTQMRRPDGTGGPLAADERIDDIQFYIDPRAELLIDDVVLYEAAAAGETRPFPRRVSYTGLFDTGKQGKEWPGDFEIVNHAPPRTWKAAKSVVRQEDGKPWLRLNLRGERKLDAQTELLFKHKLEATTLNATTLNATADVKIELYSRAAGKVIDTRTASLTGGDWSETRVAFTPPQGSSVDEIRFLLPAGELLVDDVLLYTP